MIDLAEKYAPGLVDLAHQLLPFEHAIHSFTAGPQEVEADEGRQEYLAIHVPDIYFPSDVICVAIHRDGCSVAEEESTYSITFQGLLNYLGQLPKPLHHFAR